VSSITAPGQSPPRFWRLRELAEQWGKHPSAFTRYILKPKTDRRTGEQFTLEAIRTPGEWLVPDGAIERYFERITASRTCNPLPASSETAKARQRELASVAAELHREGF
jgi:hypothetical protein